MLDAKIRLIVFDLDGTLAPFNSDQLFPDAAAWLDANGWMQPIIATNQGGIGLHYWMEKEGFGNPADYPSLPDFEARLDRLFPLPEQKPTILMCARYQSKKSGAWCPVPAELSHFAMWREDWRKPAPGMLLHAMTIAGWGPAETLMVGDGEEDRQAAANAGCSFEWAWEFFGRPAPIAE